MSVFKDLLMIWVEGWIILEIVSLIRLDETSSASKFALIDVAMAGDNVTEAIIYEKSKHQC